MFFVFSTHLSRPVQAEAEPLAGILGVTPYDARLALSAPPPNVLYITASRDSANAVLAAVRARGHGAHVFDEEMFVASESMTKMDDFRLDADGVRRAADGALLPYGDVFAILRAVHEPTPASSIPAGPRRRGNIVTDFVMRSEAPRAIDPSGEREHVAYFFRRSGERPWILRERHASYVGLGEERTAVAFANFGRTVERLRRAATMSVYDDRLVRRRVPERLRNETMLRTSRAGIDLLAHLLAMSIASQNGSPYR